DGHVTGFRRVLFRSRPSSPPSRPRSAAGSPPPESARRGARIAAGLAERAGVWHHPTTSILEPFLLVPRHLGTVLVVVPACVAVGAMAGPAAAAPGDPGTTF